MTPPEAADDLAEVARLLPQSHFRAVVEACAEGVYLVDRAGVCVYVNPAATELLGYRPENLVGQKIHAIIHHSRADGSPFPVTECTMFRAAAHGAPGEVDDEVLWRADGLPLAVDYRARPLLVGGRVEGGVVTFTDATERRAVLERLRASEQRFRQQVEHSTVGIVSASLDGRYELVNPAFCQIVGIPEERLLGRPVFDLMDAADAVAFTAHIERLRSGAATSAEFEQRYVRPDGSTVSVLKNLSLTPDEDGAPLHIQAIVQDVTARRRIEAELARRATHDPLTDLPNRMLLADRLTQSLTRPRRAPGSLAVLFVDVDNFKLVNDSFGHAAGDAILVEVARRLSRAVRPQDTVARFAGDEFVVILAELADQAEVVGVVERIQASISEPIRVDGMELVVSTSIGVARDTDEELLADSLLRDADAAMLAAKARGRARHAFFDTALRGRSRARLEAVNELRGAGDRGELVTHYQPIVELDTGRPIGVEALVRWNHPTRGLVPPAEFIGLAEETGLIVDLGDWVLHRAAADVDSWGFPGLDCSVNLSARQLAAPDVVERVTRALARSGLAPQRLTVEITETAVLEDVDEAVRVLERLKRLGLRVAVDDFGTGYASLGYLKRLPVDCVKIDRSFITGVDAGGEDAKIAAAVIGLAAALELAVVAEGIETEAQRQALIELGCRAGQGYLFARPQPSAATADFLAARGAPAAATG
jgi:diguanylate cyclase (GGDEF)-like protein/PAS domain S-box-containing protein